MVIECSLTPTKRNWKFLQIPYDDPGCKYLSERNAAMVYFLAVYLTILTLLAMFLLLFFHVKVLRKPWMKSLPSIFIGNQPFKPKYVHYLPNVFVFYWPKHPQYTVPVLGFQIHGFQKNFTSNEIPIFREIHTYFKSLVYCICKESCSKSVGSGTLL